MEALCGKYTRPSFSVFHNRVRADNFAPSFLRLDLNSDPDPGSEKTARACVVGRRTRVLMSWQIRASPYIRFTNI